VEDARRPRPVTPLEVRSDKTIAQLLGEMAATGAQGRTLGRALDLLERMLDDPQVTVFWGVAGSLAPAGQSGIVEWLVANGFVDVLVPTGANISEDLVAALGHGYVQCERGVSDEQLRDVGHNRYYDVVGREADYLRMTELIATFIESLEPGLPHSSREFLSRFGAWLGERSIGGIVAAAAARGVPIFCPALMDSAYGDAALLAHGRGRAVCLDAVKEIVEFMSLDVRETAAVYIGGGVPKDYVQTFAVSADLLHDGGPGARPSAPVFRDGLPRRYYPHRYAIQLTTDAPQWGGLSGASFEEGISWGKQADPETFVQCYCDATIALPLLAHGLAQRRPGPRRNRDFGFGAVPRHAHPPR
jgi:deoxyhypusine synthase